VSPTDGDRELIDTSDFKNGLSIIWDGEIYTIVEFQHVKPGKGPAFVRTTLKNVLTGAVIDKKFRAGEKMEQAFLERRPMQYLYRAGNDYVVMDMETYDQMNLSAAALGDGAKYLKEGFEVAAIVHEGNVIGAEVPNFVELEVTETQPAFKGDTQSGGTKPATLETGAVIQVPFFVNVGDRVKVDTRSGDYIERVR
jgi:elongation factor P